MGIARAVSKLKELQGQLQDSKRNNDVLEKARIYSEFLRTLAGLQRSFVKQAPTTVGVTESSVGALAASAFSVAVTPALLVNYVQASILGSALEKNAVEVNAALNAVLAIKDGAWKHVAAQDLSNYNLGYEV